MQIRREHPEDEHAIRAIHPESFGRPEIPDHTPLEVELVDQLRTSAAWLPPLSLVAMVDDRPVGHVVCTRAHVEEVSVLGCGPTGVVPLMQNRGIGMSLMHEVLAVADVMGESLVGLLGSPAYYARFGFVQASSVDVTAPDQWGEYFQVKTLAAYRPGITGRFRYAPLFDRF